MDFVEFKLNSDTTYGPCASPLMVENNQFDPVTTLPFFAGHAKGHKANEEVFLAFSCGHRTYIKAKGV